jgi:hypothetical protein
MTKLMRKLILCGAVVAAALLPTSAAQAYGDAPWCLKTPLGRGTVSERCDFRTFENCSSERTLSNAFCVQNSRYLPYWQGRGFGEEPVRKTTRRKKHRPQ